MLGPRPPNEGPLSLYPWTGRSQGILRETSTKSEHIVRLTVGRTEAPDHMNFSQAAPRAGGSRVPDPGCAVKSPRGPRPRLCTPQAGPTHQVPLRRAKAAARPAGQGYRRLSPEARHAGRRSPHARPAPRTPASARCGLHRGGASYLQRRPRRPEEGPARRERGRPRLLSQTGPPGGPRAPERRAAAARPRPARPSRARRGHKAREPPPPRGQPGAAGPSARRRAGARPGAVQRSRHLPELRPPASPEARGGARRVPRLPYPLFRC